MAEGLVIGLMIGCLIGLALNEFWYRRCMALDEEWYAVFDDMNDQWCKKCEEINDEWFNERIRELGDIDPEESQSGVPGDSQTFENDISRGDHSVSNCGDFVWSLRSQVDEAGAIGV